MKDLHFSQGDAMFVRCDWKHAGKRCEADAVFLCVGSPSHVTCSTHSVDGRGSGRKRVSDRTCGVCGANEVVLIYKKAPEIERRATRYTSVCAGKTRRKAETSTA